MTLEQRVEALCHLIQGTEPQPRSNVRSITRPPAEYAESLNDWCQRISDPDYEIVDGKPLLTATCREDWNRLFDVFGMDVPLDSPDLGDIKITLDSWVVAVHYFAPDCLLRETGPKAYRLKVLAECRGPHYLPYLAAVLKRDPVLLKEAASAFGVSQGIRPGHYMHQYRESSIAPWEILEELRQTLSPHAKEKGLFMEETSE